MAALIWILGAWVVMVVISLTLVQGLRLLLVPAGGYLPWRRAWILLMIAAGALWITFLRNALLVSGLDDAPIHFLNSFEARVILNGLEAVGILGCMTECYRIFRHRRVSDPTPVAQVIMNWEGFITDWNQAATELLGFSKTEAIGKELATLIIPEDLMVSFNDALMPAREAHRQGLKFFHDTGHSAIMNTIFPTTAQHQNGTRIQVKIHVTNHLTGRGMTFLGSIYNIKDTNI